MSAADVAKGVNEGQHDESEGQRNSGMADCPVCHRIDDGCACSCGGRRENREGAEKFSEQFLFHEAICISTGQWSEP